MKIGINELLQIIEKVLVILLKLIRYVNRRDEMTDKDFDLIKTLAKINI